MLEITEDAAAEAALTDDIKIARARCKEIADGIEQVQVDTLALKQSSIQHVDQVSALEEKFDRLWHDIYGLVACAMRWRHSENEVAAWCARAADMEATHTSLTPSLVEDLLRVKKVPNAPLLARFKALVDASRREALEARITGQSYELGSTANTVLSRIEVETGIDRRDADRYLGHSYLIREGRRHLHIFINYDKAVVLAHALRMTPQQAGI